MQISRISGNNQSFGIKCPNDISKQIKKSWIGISDEQTSQIVSNLKETGSNNTELKKIKLEREPAKNSNKKIFSYNIFLELKTGESKEKSFYTKSLTFPNGVPTTEEINEAASWLIQDAECEYIKSKLHTSMGKTLSKDGGFEQNCGVFLSDYADLCRSYPKERGYIKYVKEAILQIQ